MTTLVTGAGGSVGTALVPLLSGNVVATDRDELDVTDFTSTWVCVQATRPRVIYHLAGAKHAPDGEVDPAHVANVNIDGTLHVLDAAREVGARVILASTCKACDPETAYGASKLIAERAVLNAGGVVVRFHNIEESSGNVFELWRSLPADVALPVTDCWRYFIRMDDAVALLLAAPQLGSGRYAVDPGEPDWMPRVAGYRYPGREQVRVPRRRGDRYREPLMAACEGLAYHDGWLRITSPHDPAVAEVEAVAA